MASFTLHAANGRVYARNVDQHLIDLGALTREDGGSFCYLLDGNKQSAAGFASAQDALRDLSRHLRFLWLDGQFTAVEPVAEVNLEGAPSLEITLDELKPGERAYDATV
jgi:hypothetical protein